MSSEKKYPSYRDRWDRSYRCQLGRFVPGTWSSGIPQTHINRAEELDTAAFAGQSVAADCAVAAH